ncbi:hypothetical protein ES319_D13G117400v1 [Gossypium barbadense]|uniref:Uncharacterized protein n=1 Tax=Gossypium barbadense TaxID=3634 RepID=A0A5J5NKT7_GOSBA|nr:hypothetical protein ES319_D13G117400v1 [Gossypium barbadense]
MYKKIHSLLFKFLRKIKILHWVVIFSNIFQHNIRERNNQEEEAIKEREFKTYRKIPEILCLCKMCRDNMQFNYKMV